MRENFNALKLSQNFNFVSLRLSKAILEQIGSSRWLLKQPDNRLHF